jgi:hypothetical protein
VAEVIVSAGGFTADVAGLYELSGALVRTAEVASAAREELGQVPAPEVGVYGWGATAEAVGEVVSAWSAEVDLVRRMCVEMGHAARHDADHLQQAEDMIAGRFGGGAAVPR